MERTACDRSADPLDPGSRRRDPSARRRGFSTWPLAAVWLAILAALRVFGRLPADRFERIALAVATLPMLFLAAFEGGWYLLPAAVAWLLVEIAGRPPTPRVA